MSPEVTPDVRADCRPPNFALWEWEYLVSTIELERMS